MQYVSLLRFFCFKKNLKFFFKIKIMNLLHFGKKNHKIDELVRIGRRNKQSNV